MRANTVKRISAVLINDSLRNLTKKEQIKESLELNLVFSPSP